MAYERNPTRGLALLVLAGLVAGAAQAGEAPMPIHQRVEKVLKQHCFRCHSHQANKSRGSLMLDSREALLAGGDTGPAIVPGDPDASLLIQAVRQSDEISMPPNGKIPESDIALLVDWVKQGAPWPGEKGQKMTARPRGLISEQDRQWWSFRPVQRPPLPNVTAPSAEVEHPVDRFILAPLAALGHSISPPADRRTLIRRLYFDLIGLPPSPEEVEAFVQDREPAAYEKLVDRLLASPAYGERWARHWLDIVRFAESDGYRADEFRPDAWRYRDYVVRSLNQDKPFSQFLREQLAGDEIAPDDPEARLATSFLALGIYEYNNRDVRTQWDNMIYEVTDVVGDVFLGLGIGCARCHDHKFDPILQKDYYRLRSFFAPLDFRKDIPLATKSEIDRHREQLARWLEKTAEIRAKIARLEEPYLREAGRKAIDMFPPDIQKLILSDEQGMTPLDKQLRRLAYRQVQREHELVDRRIKDEPKKEWLKLKAELAKFDKEKPADLPTAWTIADIGPESPETTIPKRTSEGLIEPAFLTVLSSNEPLAIKSKLPKSSTGRRTALADWLADPAHPLVPRVIVNRLWKYHFGKGIVGTTSDFGTVGDPPSHPELLDWLTSEFLASGGRFKALHRLLVTSATYRQSGQNPGAAALSKQDPENKLWWRMPPRRLDAEQIRDALLAVSGSLDRSVGGPSVDAVKPRRSLYVKSFRNRKDPLLEVFDIPDGIASAPERYATTTPPQSLFLINSKTMLEYAAAVAKRLEREGVLSSARVPEDAALDRLYQLLFSRPPTQTDRQLLRGFLAEQERTIHDSETTDEIWAQGRIPFREGKALAFDGRTKAKRASPLPELRSSSLPTPLGPKFTVEVFFVLQSLYDDGKVRPLVTSWSGDKRQSGWSFGVTSKKSAFKPQSLVLQVWGKNAQGVMDYEPVFSDLHIDLGRPYFVALAVDLETTDKPGIVFYSKDLSNDDEPLQIDSKPHRIVRADDPHPVWIGVDHQRTSGQRRWDGLIDDVRLSRGRLEVEELLLTRDGVHRSTVAYWQFEPATGMLADSSPHRIDLEPPSSPSSAGGGNGDTAWIDLCHVLLNSSEFLYVD